MNTTNIKATKKEHTPDCACSICGLHYKGIAFKNGFLCESCLEYIKESYPPDSSSSTQNT